MTEYTIESRQTVHSPLPEVFEFFSDARNLEAITPPWMNFKILTPEPIIMAPGLRIDYSIRLRGIPLRWQSEITVWEPGRRFVDEQRRGPYRYWIHEHTFESRPEGTVVGDRVRYAVPGGGLVHKLLVRPDLDKVFAYRRRRIPELLQAQAVR